MNKIFLVCTALLLIFVGCQRQIDINVASADGRLIIQGDVSELRGGAMVQLSRSVALNASILKFVDNGTVILTDITTGITNTLTYTGKDGYYMSKIPISLGSIYQLEARVDGVNYVSQCSVPLANVPIDSITLIKRKPMMGVEVDSAFTITTYFTDPEPSDDYYHLLVWRNNDLKTFFKVGNDYFIKGSSYGWNTNIMLQPGDSVRVELQHITYDIYCYYSQLAASQSPMVGAPANAKSNIKASDGGETFGYFSAFSADTASLVRP